MVHILPAVPLGTTDQMSPIRAADPIAVAAPQVSWFAGVLAAVEVAKQLRELPLEGLDPPDTVLGVGGAWAIGVRRRGASRNVDISRGMPLPAVGRQVL